jgi:hypothetical protein
MGGCCFAPRKTQLLWWYWLLLFSVVGIPMFAAALYVRRAARHGLIEPWQARRASLIFWLGACLPIVLFVAFSLFLIFNGARWPWLEHSRDMLVFAAGFLFWLAMAVGAAKLTEKARTRHTRLALAASCAVVPAAVVWLPYALLSFSVQRSIGLLPLGVMKFLACMVPAHYWYRFTVTPSTKRAWLFLATLALGTALFWVVSQYGYDVHVGLHRWVAAMGSHR